MHIIGLEKAMVTTHCCRYVATRWYRAPEIMLNWMHYNQTGNIMLITKYLKIEF